MAEKVKAGYKTTEFWLSSLAAIVGLIMSSGALDEMASDHWAVKVTGLVVTLLSAMGYTAARGKVKSGEKK